MSFCPIRDWCKTRRDAKEPEPIGKAVTTAARHMGKTWSKLSLAALGAAAIASTMVAAHVASPDYDYAQLKSSTSLTRLAEPGVSNKILESFSICRALRTTSIHGAAQRHWPVPKLRSRICHLLRAASPWRGPKF